jgi:hypothetical protein
MMIGDIEKPPLGKPPIWVPETAPKWRVYKGRTSTWRDSWIAQPPDQDFEHSYAFRRFDYAIMFAYDRMANR